MYPTQIRLRDFSTTYVNIAMRHYLDAKSQCNTIIRGGVISDEVFGLCPLFYQNVIICVVFSHMAIESFLNDYAAACLGDEVFYKSFDSLNILSKFQLIAMLILKSDFDKKESYWSFLLELNKLRNSYAHNKSERSDKEYTASDVAFLKGIYEEFGNLMPPLVDGTDFRATLRLALNALKAVRDVAKYFDTYDNQCCAIKRLFGTNSLMDDRPFKTEVLSDLAIK